MADATHHDDDSTTTATEGTMAPITAADALHEIRAAAERDAATHASDFVIGTVGQDVPLELIHAAGACAFRLRGNPEWDTAPADRYLGRGLDPATRSLLAGILSGAFGPLDAIVVSSDCDASQRLYYVLREMRRVDPETTVPPVHLVDVLHLPRAASTRYTAAKLREFLDVLERWTGTRPDEAAIEHAVAEQDATRALQRAAMRLRSAVPAKMSGCDALAVFAAADRMPRPRYHECLEALVAGAADLPALSGRRIFLTGSNHDHHGVYREIEARGTVIVGEDHDHGELLAERDVRSPGAPAEVLEAITLRYQHNGPTAQRASIGARAAHTAAGIRRTSAELLLSYVRLMDEAPLWDFAAQRRESPVPAGVVVRQPYGRIHRGDLDRALTAPEATGVNE
ncbi:2-hydroxyacyl-CoA dehydratase family protein [Salinibacterium sp. SYSU T00001]|uniref:2-hydroxyacyl-CoA dehydratase family protein n=1 Tax=Homoserinimonas sedimenticola TaxID=2986805 RepID=UPI002236BA24|nr:2-hydroxyacyl-CoA dehydratase family protein [Salinibacterium sedimenticola]MCW4384632.1 2-hydroxyacyl-CoA dehydratase family protein [Salinibacterium sedimenticola]